MASLIRPHTELLYAYIHMQKNNVYIPSRIFALPLQTCSDGKSRCPIPFQLWRPQPIESLLLRLFLPVAIRTRT